MNLWNKLYELRNYEDEAIAYIANKTIELAGLYEDGMITEAEFKELVTDLQQTRIIAETAERLETKILLEQLLGDLITGISSI